MVLKLKKLEKVYIFIKIVKTKNKYQKLDYVKIRLLFIKARIKLATRNLSFSKIIEYLLYIIIEISKL